MKQWGKKVLSIILLLCMISSTLPVQVFAEALQRELIAAGENTMTEDILSENVFYFASSDVQIPENSKAGYVIRIGRGGDCADAASVLVRISDFSSRYGEDYTVALLDGEKAAAPKDSFSFMDLMVGSYEVGVIADEDKLNSEMEHNSEFRDEAAEAVNEAISYIEENADLAPAFDDDQSMTMADIEENAEKLYMSPLQQAYADATGIHAEHQKVTAAASEDPLAEMQDMANLVSSFTVGASLNVEFAPGVSSRYLVVMPKDNKDAVGDRYCYLTLTDPMGATVSICSSCAVSIVEDEDVSPCEVYFDGYEVGEDAVTVYISRSGSLYNLTHVNLTTTGNGSAEAGYDYSPVDTSILFPMGIPEMKLDIPINTDGMNGVKDFELQMDSVVNAVIGEGTQTIYLGAEVGNEDAPAAAGPLISRNLSTVDIDEKNPVKLDGAKSYFYRGDALHMKGFQKYDYEMGAWRTRWYDYNLIGAKKGYMVVQWKIGSPLFYSGIQANIQKDGNCFTLKTRFGIMNDSSGEVEGPVSFDSSRQFYESKDFWDIRDVDLSAFAETYTAIDYYSGCSDCDELRIYSIDRIYRWYQLTMKPAETPLFLTAAGELAPINEITNVTVSGANVETPNVTLAHLNDELMIIPKGSQYLTIGEIRDGGNTLVVYDNKDNSAYEFDMTADMIRTLAAGGNLEFLENKAQGGTRYGLIDLYYTMNYRPAQIKLNHASGGDLGTLNLSGTDRAVGTSYEYHRGDVIRISCDMDRAYADDYQFAGVWVKTKENADDMFANDEIFIAAEDSALYLDQSTAHRLQYGYYEVTPAYTKKSTSLTVRVSEDDAELFDLDYGFFTDIGYFDFESVRIDGVDYRDYNLSDIRVGKLYSLPVKCISEKYAPVWTLRDGKTYGGDVFYFQADSKETDTLIRLSAQYSAYGFTKMTLSGTVQRKTYDASTALTGSRTVPFAGAMVICGESCSITGEDGRYSISVTVPAGMNFRYLVSNSGHTILRETNANAASKTENILLNPENGTLLSNLSISFGPNGSMENVVFLHGGISHLVVGDNGGVLYRKTISRQNGSIEETDAKERMTGLEVIVRSADGAERMSYTAVYDEKEDGFVVDINQGDIAGGDMLYLKVTSDKAAEGLMSVDGYGNPVDPEILAAGSRTDYHEVFSGFTFASTGMSKLNVKYKFNGIPDIDFYTLPMIGKVGFYMSFPYVHVNIEERDGDYIFSVGVSVMDFVDALKSTHINLYNNGGLYAGIMEGTEGNIFERWGRAMKGYAGIIDKMQTDAVNGENNVATLGGPTCHFNIAVGGYMRFSLMTIRNYQTGEYKTDFYFTGWGGYIGVQGGFRWDAYWIWPVICMPGYFGIQAEIMVNGFFGASVKPEELQNPITKTAAETTSMELGGFTCFDGSTKMQFSGAVFTGIGIDGILGARGGGQLVFVGLYEPNPNPEIGDIGAVIMFKAGIWLDLYVSTIPIMYTIDSIPIGSMEYYAKVAAAAAQNDAVGDADFVMRTPYTDAASDWVGDIPLPQAGFSEVQSQTLVVNPYEHPDAQLCTLDNGDILMAFIDSDENSDARTVLKVSLYHGSKWSTPVTVQGDGASDFQPRMTAMADGKALLAWVSSAPGAEKTDSVSEFLSELDIYAAVIDASGDIKVGEIECLTKDELGKFYDSAPVCVYDTVSGDYAVFYIKADPNNYDAQGNKIVKKAVDLANPYTNDSVVAYMLHTDSGDGRGPAWVRDDASSAAGKAVEGWNGQRFVASPIEDLGIYAPAITNITSAVYDRKAVLAYSIDADSSNDTQEDKEIYIQIFDFKTQQMRLPVRLTEDSVSDTVPQIAVSGDQSVLFWYREGQGIAFLDLDDLIACGLDGDRVASDYHVSANTVGTPMLDRLYGYVRPSGMSDTELASMTGFRTAISGENLYVVWPQIPTLQDKDVNCVELYATALDMDTEVIEGDTIMKQAVWSKPYRLTKNLQFIDEANLAVTEDGRMIVVYNSYDQTVTEDPSNPVIISDLKLESSTLISCGAVDVCDITLSDNTPDSGEEVLVTVTLENNGLTRAEGYELKLYEVFEGNKTLIGEKSSAASGFMPGAERIETFIWTAPEKITGTSLLAEVYETGGDWSNISVYETDPLIGHADFELTDYQVIQTPEGMMIRFTAENTGNEVSEQGDVYTLTQTGPFSSDCGLGDDEHTLAEISLSGIAPGEKKTFETLLTIPVSAFAEFGYLTAYSMVQTHEDDFVLGRSVTIRPQQPMEYYMNGETIPAALSMTEGDALDLAFSTMPKFMVSAVVVSSDESVAVFENGQLIAKGEGVAEITPLIMPYGYELEPIRIEVTAEPEEIDPTPDEPVPDEPTPEDHPVDPVFVNPFVDLEDGAFYYDAVLWAAENGITSGTDETHFTPDRPCTRAEVVTFLWRAAGSPEPENSVTFPDVEAGSYYEKAVAWAVENHITNGVDGGLFAPGMICSRAQIVTFLYRFHATATTDLKDNPFIDVREGQYYYDAVLWAADSGITLGTGDNRFSPDADCTRSQIVTFLYRYMTE